MLHVRKTSKMIFTHFKRPDKISPSVDRNKCLLSRRALVFIPVELPFRCMESNGKNMMISHVFIQLLCFKSFFLKSVFLTGCMNQ
jgi:hypothetical protein